MQGNPSVLAQACDAIPQESYYVGTTLLPKLTSRQRQMALMASNGFSNKEIAERLHVAESTVKNTLYTVYFKLGINTPDISLSSWCVTTR